MANDVTAAVVDVTAAAASAAKARPVKSAHPAKVDVVVKAAARHVPKVATNCAKAKHAPHAANVLSVLLAIALRVKAAAKVVARTATKAAARLSPS